VPEASGHRRTCSHAELTAFLDAVEAAGDPRVVRTSFGITPEGRELPLLIVADPPVVDAEAARASDRPRVLVMANIHAGEVEGKEACLQLLREIVWGTASDKRAVGGEPYDVSRLVLLLAPIYNADGNDRFGPRNRPLQNGPEQAGQRATAAGLDLNRDYLKLEAEEARDLVALIDAWDPHVVVDLHTTNGSAHGYELTYSPPLTPSAHPDLLATLEDGWLPALRRRMRERWGYETFDYGNFMTDEGGFKDEPDTMTGWRTFDHRPRFGNNYVGLRNRLAILSEAYSYADFETRIAAIRAFVTEILRLAAEQGVALDALCRRLDQETAAAGRRGALLQATGAELVARGRPEPLLLRAVEERNDPATGERLRVATGPRTTIEVPCFVRFAATQTVRAPRAYLIPPERARLAERLARHGLRFETLDAARDVWVDVFRLRTARRAEQPFQGHRAWTLDCTVDYERRELPAGSLRVSLDQPLARLAFQLLDPRADDGLFVWGAFDDLLGLGPGTELPIYGER
jgi:hypothetical protein